MEVCGGQTHSILKYGIQELLPKKIALLHGPGCPVFVTPVAWIDKAIAIAKMPGTILTSFGDMLRVPRSSEDLLQARARGADVRIVLAPPDALAIAKQNTGKEVVFFCVGFETTAPASAALVAQAAATGVGNLSLLVCHVLVPPALRALLDNPQNAIDGFLAAGHVCTVMGFEECDLLGFDPLNLANEGRFIAILPKTQVISALAILKKHPVSKGAIQIGQVTSEKSKTVILKTNFGTQRHLDRMTGDMLPRIC